jgi:hypothetical protein
MTSSAVLNLIVSILAVGLLATVLRVAYMVAGGRLERTPATTDVDTAYELERAA